MNRYYYSVDHEGTPTMACVARTEDAQAFESNQRRALPLVACSRLEWEAVIDNGAWLITELATLRRGRTDDQVESSKRRSALCAQSERLMRQRSA